MVAPKRTPFERERDLAVIAGLYARGKSQAEIAHQMETSQQQVSYDLAVLRKRWLKQSMSDLDERRGVELAKIDHLEASYWDAWERSRQQREITSTESSQDDDGKRLRASVRKEQRDGNPAYLEGVRWCIDRRITLLGLDAPERVEVLVRQEAERLAQEYGLDVEDVLREAQGILQASSP